MWKSILTLTAKIFVLTLIACVDGFTQTPPAGKGLNPSAQDATRPPAVAGPATKTPPAVTPNPEPSGALWSQPTATPPPRSRPDPARATSTHASLPAPMTSAETSLASLLEPRPLPPMPTLMRIGVVGGNVLTLSLNDALRLALANNNEIEVARGEVLFGETALRSLEAFYDPVFRFTPEINHSSTPTASSLGGSDRSGAVTTTDLNFNSSIIKPFRKGGGHYELFFNNTRETTSSTFAQLSPFYSSNFGVQFTQPLLRNRSIDLNRRAIRVQQKLLAQSDADFRRRTMDIIVQVQRAYWEMIFALREQQNQVANVHLARELFRQTETRVVAGSVAPLERAEVQTELANRESELIAASQNVSVAENTLKRLLLRDVLAKEWSASLVPTDEPSFDDAPLRLDDALDEARANRPELQRLRLQEEINHLDAQYWNNQSRPRVDIRATISTNGLAGTPTAPAGAVDGGTSGGRVPLIGGDPATNASAFLLAQINQMRSTQGLSPADVPLVAAPSQGGVGVPANLDGGYARTVGNLLSLKTHNVLVGVVIEIPFRNRKARAELAGTRIRQTQLAASTRMQEQDIEFEVRNAAQGVESARLRVLSARVSRQNAELQRAGEQRLYEVGQSTTFLLFQRENQLSTARSLELRAQTDYNKALADLQRATSTTLRANNILIN